MSELETVVEIGRSICKWATIACGATMIGLVSLAAIFFDMNAPAPEWWESGMWKAFGLGLLTSVNWVGLSLLLMKLEDRA